MHWEFEKLEEALEVEDIALAKRYLGKLRQILFCAKCGKPVRFEVRDAENYFKGYRHTECRRA